MKLGIGQIVDAEVRDYFNGLDEKVKKLEEQLRVYRENERRKYHYHDVDDYCRE